MFMKNRAHELELESKNSFELLRSRYGLGDAGDFWYESHYIYLINDLHMKQNMPDSSIYFCSKSGMIAVINSKYVDDLLRFGTRMFEENSIFFYEN